jgi:hypothetical protein
VARLTQKSARFVPARQLDVEFPLLAVDIEWHEAITPLEAVVFAAMVAGGV